MAWKDQLRAASFRGVQFFVQSAEGSFGRRVVIHEFPRRKFPFAEDIGLKPREFSLSAFVLGEDYFPARNALLSACQEAGPGILVHPYLGRILAVCTGVTLKESSTDGGFAEFTLSFVESDALAPEPKALADSLGKLAAASAALREYAIEYIDASFSVISEVNAVVELGVQAVEGVVDDIGKVENAIRGNVLKIAEFSYKLRKLNAKVNQVLAIPGALGVLFVDVYGTLKDALGGNEEAADLFIRLTTPIQTLETQKKIPGERPTVKRAVKNAEALDQYRKQVVISYQADILAETAFVSLDDAVEARGKLLEVIEEQKEIVEDDGFQALEDLRIAILESVPASDQALSRIVEIPVESSTPSLVFAYDIYEDLEREQDIVDRNKLVHPGFIAPGSKLKVLQSG